MSKFAGGIGTKESPYLIADAAQFDKIETDISNKETAIGNIKTAIDKPKNFKLIKDIVLGADYKTKDAFVGNLDGAGYSISVEGKGGYKKLFQGVANATFENIKLLQGETELILCAYTGYIDTGDINVDKHNYPTTFRNIVATQEGYTGTTLMVAEKNSLLCSQVVAGDANFIDCNIIGSYVNVSGKEYMGLIVGNYIGSTLGYDIDVLFDGCTFEGSFYSIDAGFLIGNCTGFFNTTSKDGKYPGKANITVKNCANNGFISYTNSGNVLGIYSIPAENNSKRQLVEDFNRKYENARGEIFRVDSEDLGVSLTLDENKQIIINSTKNYSYNVSFSVSTTTYSGGKQIGTHYFIVKNYIENKTGDIETGVYYNKVNPTVEQSDTSGYDNHNANLKYKYTVNDGYRVDGKHDNIIEKISRAFEFGEIPAYIVVFEKNDKGVLVVKGAIAYKG